MARRCKWYLRMLAVVLMQATGEPSKCTEEAKTDVFKRSALTLCAIRCSAFFRATLQQQITLGSRVLISGTPEQVSELITEGAPVNYLDVMKRTPLHWASERYGPTLRFA